VCPGTGRGWATLPHVGVPVAQDTPHLSWQQEPRGPLWAGRSSPSFLGSMVIGSPMVMGPTGALACSEYGTWSWTDIPCRAEARASQGSRSCHSSHRTHRSQWELEVGSCCPAV
jgi:hypothetical protein